MERRLATLVVDFVNSPPPETDQDVDVLDEFVRQTALPFISADRWYSTATIALWAPGHRDTVYGNVRDNLHEHWDDLRWIVAELAKGTMSPDARNRLVAVLQQQLCHGVNQSEMQARVWFGFSRGRGFHLIVQPILSSADDALWYGVALLADHRRGFAEGLAQCRAPTMYPTPCSRFFWRSSRAQRYCSAVCSKRARLAKTVRRVQRWRVRTRE